MDDGEQGLTSGDFLLITGNSSDSTFSMSGTFDEENAYGSFGSTSENHHSLDVTDDGDYFDYPDESENEDTTFGDYTVTLSNSHFSEYTENGTRTLDGVGATNPSGNGLLLPPVTGSYSLFNETVGSDFYEELGSYEDESRTGTFTSWADEDTTLTYDYSASSNSTSTSGDETTTQQTSALVEADGLTNFHATNDGTVTEEGAAGTRTLDFTDDFVYTLHTSQSTEVEGPGYSSSHVATVDQTDDSLSVYHEEGAYAADGAESGDYHLTENSLLSFTVAVEISGTQSGSSGSGGMPPSRV